MGPGSSSDDVTDCGSWHLAPPGDLVDRQSPDSVHGAHDADFPLVKLCGPVAGAEPGVWVIRLHLSSLPAGAGRSAVHGLVADGVDGSRGEAG